MTQNEMILSHLRKGLHITPKYAEDEFGCMRLASRIADLRNMGINVQSKMIYRKNKKGVLKKWAEYWLEGATA